MGDVWILLVCVVTVGLNKANDRAEQQKKQDAVSPNDLALNDVIAFLQSMDSTLKQISKNVQLETNEVELVNDAPGNMTTGDAPGNMTTGDAPGNMTTSCRALALK
ncbi:uncharacterized protein [Nothobranchius furzeri]|uniref:uncharacterized protein isoform X2 n=1 Tax=Nothobranchius furzeri TaxID=105023 RepID=UPI003904A134